MKKIIQTLFLVVIIAGCQAQTNDTSILNQGIDSEEKSEHIKEQDLQTEHKTIVLYELGDDYFDKPYSEIPYYYQGNIKFLENEVFTQHEEGHQPWLANAIDVVTTVSANLTGEETPYLNLNYDNHKRLTTSTGIVLEEVTKTLIKLHAPHVGVYEFEMKSPVGTSVLFVSKITLVTGSRP